MQHDGAADDGARYTFGEFVLTDDPGIDCFAHGVLLISVLICVSMLLPAGRGDVTVEVVSHPSESLAARQEIWCRSVVCGYPNPDELAGVELTLAEFEPSLARVRDDFGFQMIGRWGNAQGHERHVPGAD